MVLSLIEMMSILLCALWDSLCLLGRHICFCLGPFYCLGCLFCFFELHKLFLCFGHEFLVGMFDCEYIFSFSELSFSFVEGFLFYANVSGRLGPVFFFTLDWCFIILRSGFPVMNVKVCPVYIFLKNVMCMVLGNILISSSFSLSEEPTHCSSEGLSPTSIPSIRGGGFPFLQASTALDVGKGLDSGHSDRLEVTPRCRVDRHFPNV